MGKGMLAKRITIAACAAVIASFAFVGSAFAITVHGADYYGTGGALQAGEVDVLNVDGAVGETIFVTVKRGDTVIAKNYPYTIEKDDNAADGAEYAGAVTFDIAGFSVNELTGGTYSVTAYAQRSGEDQLYLGKVYGVYADLPDGTQKLIGTRTVNESEMATRTFEPSETLYANSKTYRLAGEATLENGVLHFPYEEYDEATTVDGVIKYVDASGATIATTKVPGLAQNERRTVDIPTVIKADDRSLYRTVCFQKSVEAINPGATSFSIYCVKMSEASQALSGYYVATINMVDKGGNVIASDSVNVTGDFLYTAPATIYKTEAVSGESKVVTYALDDEVNVNSSYITITPDGRTVVNLSPASAPVANRALTFNVVYTASTAPEKETDVTFTLIDGSKRISDPGRIIGTSKVKATKDAPAVPEAKIEANGTTYTIAGSVDDYAYAVGSGEVPAIDVYYTPEGYTAPGTYEVTVNYVNFLTNSVIESHKYTSDPSGSARIEISPPESFSANGVDYVRLDGQETDISHSYYSGTSTYTVYYRDKNDELTSGTVINRIRVVYTDGGTTTVADQGTTPDGATALQLNAERTYNVMDGVDGNATLTNEAGVDSNTERIEDSETPLASGFDKGASSGAAASLTQMTQWIIPVGIAAVAVIAIVVAVVTIRRRKADEEYEL